MSIWSKRIFLSVAALGLLMPTSGAFAGNLWGNSSGPYHWEKADTDSSRVVTVGNNHRLYDGKGRKKVDVGEDPIWGPMLRDEVVPDWDDSGDPNLTVTEVLGGEGDVESYNDEYKFNGWLGLASITIDTNRHIQTGEVKVNDSYFNLSTYDGDVARRHVLCQEVGHVFGLHHNRGDDDTCMNDQSDLFADAGQSPNLHDGDMLNDVTMYAHVHDAVAPPEPDPEPTCRGKSGNCFYGVGGPNAGVRSFTVATWVERYDNESEMFDAADLVVDATVLSSNFDRMVGRADRAVPVTQVTLEVTETYEGFSLPVITLEQTRGPGVEIVDDPGYVQGDSYTLYLREIGNNTYRTVNPDGRIRN